MSNNNINNKNLDIIKSKIYNWNTIQYQISIWKSENKKIVFTNGCFDIFGFSTKIYVFHKSNWGNF